MKQVIEETSSKRSASDTIEDKNNKRHRPSKTSTRDIHRPDLDDVVRLIIDTIQQIPSEIEAHSKLIPKFVDYVRPQAFTAETLEHSCRSLSTELKQFSLPDLAEQNICTSFRSALEITFLGGILASAAENGHLLSTVQNLRTHLDKACSTDERGALDTLGMEDCSTPDSGTAEVPTPRTNTAVNATGHEGASVNTTARDAASGMVMVSEMWNQPLVSAPATFPSNVKASEVRFTVSKQAGWQLDCLRF